jgi:hypothetical protein
MGDWAAMVCFKQHPPAPPIGAIELRSTEKGRGPKDDNFAA